MFDSLRKKFSSWLGKDKKTEEKEKKSAKAKKKETKSKEKKQEKSSKLPKESEKSKKTTEVKEVKTTKKVKKERSAEEITQEREISDKVIQDIKKEGLDTKSPDVKVQEAIEEIEEEKAKELKEEAEIEEENIELEQKELEETKKSEKKEETKEKKKFKLWPFGKKKKDEIIEEKIEEEKELEEDKVKVNETLVVATDIKEKEESFFSKLARKLSTSALKEEDFEDAFQDLEITLLENNTALEAVDKIKESLKASLVNKEIKKDKIKDTIIQSLKDSILSVLIEPPNLIEQIKKKEGPFTIVFFGINGSGKTTSIAKLAHLLKKENISCVLAAGDTFRAASIEQLKTHADKIGVPIISSNYGSDPASVAFDAKKYAKSHNIKVVLIDTAGRMYTKANLLKEMEKIIRISEPDLKIFVGESITGNDATEQAKTFNEVIGIDGIILSKADIDEKAGTILSVSHVTNKPIYYLGTGQEYDDLELFSKATILKNLGLE